MFKKILILFALISFNYVYSAEKMAIVTSVSPLAVLTKMIAGDKAEVVSMCSNNQCPHHYFITPGQYSHIKNANLIIYIDDNFEIFMQNVLKENKASVLKLSENDKLLTKAGNKENWHLWLSTKNIGEILNSIKIKLSEIDPVNKVFYGQNCETWLKKLEMMRLSISERLKPLPKLILLDNSLNYFFSSFDHPVETIEFGDQLAPRSVSEAIESIKKFPTSSHVIISSHQNQEKFQNLLGSERKVITINTESWNEKGDIETLMEGEFEKVIKSLEQCK